MESGHTAVLRLPFPPNGTLAFALVPLASSTSYTTERISVADGDTIRLTIANYLPFSVLVK